MAPISQADARLQIIQAANRHRLRTNPNVARICGLYSARHLQRAVSVCRANELVTPITLLAAGFNPTGPRRRAARKAN